MLVVKWGRSEGLKNVHALFLYQRFWPPLDQIVLRNLHCEVALLLLFKALPRLEGKALLKASLAWIQGGNFIRS